MTIQGRGRRIALPMFYLSLAACGGAGGGGETCASWTPCGGDVVGRWSIADTCSVDTRDPSCPGATGSLSGFRVEGTYEFAAGGTYSATVTTQGSASISVPVTCLSGSGVTITCADLNMVYMSGAADPAGPVASASCLTVRGACTCVVGFRPVPVTVQGTFSTSGNRLTTTQVGREPQVGDYCVAGNQMTLGQTMPVSPMPNFSAGEVTTTLMRL